MASILSIKTYKEVGEDLESALTWIERGGGFSLDRTRLGRYRSLMRDLLAAHATGDDARFKKKEHDYINVLYEAYELIEMHKGLKIAPINGLSTLFKKLGDGTTWRGEEKAASASIVGRNTAVELMTAAMFTAAGYPIDLANGEDVTVRTRYGHIFVECKRPLAATKVFWRLGEAIDQCNGRVPRPPHPGDSGVVVMDMTRVGNPTSERYEFATREEIVLYMRDGLLRICDQINRKKPLANEKYMLGILVRFSALAFSRDQSLPNYTTYKIFIKNSNLEGVRKRLAASMAAKLQEPYKLGKKHG